MDSWFAWIERHRLHGRFLSHCAWAIAPSRHGRLQGLLAVPRILAVAGLWSYLPLAAVTLLGWAALGAFGVAAGETGLILLALALGLALALPPLVMRAGLMPLAWAPAMGALALGETRPAARIRKEAETRLTEWSAAYG